MGLAVGIKSEYEKLCNTLTECLRLANCPLLIQEMLASQTIFQGHKVEITSDAILPAS